MRFVGGRGSNARRSPGSYLGGGRFARKKKKLKPEIDKKKLTTPKLVEDAEKYMRHLGNQTLSEAELKEVVGRLRKAGALNYH